MELPTEEKVTIFVTAEPSEWAESGLTIFTYAYDPTNILNRKEVIVAKKEVTVQIPKQEIRGQIIERLEDRKKEMAAEYQVRKEGIEREIAELKALEYNPDD